jgi:hypothetical protein
MTAEQWLPIPGYAGRYEISSRGRVRTVEHVVTRRDGSTYRVPARMRRIGVDHRGLACVKLATGQRARYGQVYPDQLLGRVVPRPDGGWGALHPSSNGPSATRRTRRVC